MPAAHEQDGPHERARVRWAATMTKTPRDSGSPALRDPLTARTDQTQPRVVTAWPLHEPPEE